jgi:hypothetical protein
MEAEDKAFSDVKLAEASTYPLEASLKAKLARNEFGEFIVKQPNGLYKAQRTIGLSVEDYAVRVSSKYRHANPVSHSTGTSSLKESSILVDKSVQAALAAIEIYNKPDFAYREETFSILLVNSWELLLKAKILLDSMDSLEVLYIPEGGKPGKFQTGKSGNAKTISIGKCIEKLDLDPTLRDNLFILIELRDNSIHLRNTNPLLNIKLLEVGTASLHSYLELVKEWFDKDLSKYNFYIMPMSFYHAHELKSYSINSDSEQHKNLLKFISEKETEHESEHIGRHNITLVLETEFVKSRMRLDPTNEKAIPVQMSYEAFRKKYPWTYQDHLIPKLKDRYSDFQIDKKFHEIKDLARKDDQYAFERPLDPDKPHSKKWFYGTNIFKVFDQHYTKK